MNATGIVRQQPTFVEHEGYTYLELNGEYFKGCRRCGGEGHYSYNGEHSRCFECDNGAIAKLGEQLASKEAAEKWCHVRRLARENRERKAEEKRMVEVRALEAKVAALPEDVREFLLNVELNEYDGPMDYYGSNPNPNYEKNAFVRSMAEQVQYVTNARRPFTEKMIEAVRKNIEQRQIKKMIDDAKPALVEGRRVITGKVISTKAVEGDYGTSYKMLVEEEGGARVFGSIPGNIWDEVEFLGAYRKHAWNETDGVMAKLVNMELTFTATVEVSRDDKSFGFFKRPAKAAIVA